MGDSSEAATMLPGDLAAATGGNHLRIFDGSMWVSESWILAK
jgi:hypothetical protein